MNARISTARVGTFVYKQTNCRAGKWNQQRSSPTSRLLDLNLLKPTIEVSRGNKPLKELSYLCGLTEAPRTELPTGPSWFTHY